jgi:ABC-2 type transport system ATP-binding protein
MMSLIAVDGLTKSFHVPERDPGLGAALRSLGRRRYRTVHALRDVSFSVEPGEMIALLGPNGAGKTTTLKLLAGLLHPTAGTALVAGFVPWERRPAYLRQLAMVAGNRSQLTWDIPPLDSWRVLAAIYDVPPAGYRETVDELVALLEMQELLARPVRNLSLGERMKCELVASLLHRPQLLFLDEPTLGLDVSMQRRLRQFVAAYNERHGVTVILTSHYMADVVALCPRVLLINEGALLYDGPLQQLAAHLAPFKLVRLTLRQGSNGVSAASSFGNLQRGLGAAAELLDQSDTALTLRVRRADTAAVTAHLLGALPVADLAVEDPPVENVIDQIYEQGIR